jgi:hypothetical protein
LRTPLAAIGTFIGATGGMCIALIIGAIACTPHVSLVRLIAMAAAAGGAGVGFVVSNILATSVLRARFLEERVTARLPAATALPRRRLPSAIARRRLPAGP